MKTTKVKWRLNVRKFERTGIRTYHKCTIPGVTRARRAPGGPSFKPKYWQGGNLNSKSQIKTGDVG